MSSTKAILLRLDLGNSPERARHQALRSNRYPFGPDFRHTRDIPPDAVCFTGPRDGRWYKCCICAPRGHHQGKRGTAFCRIITAQELLQTRFVNQIADTPKGDGAKFREWVLWELESRVGDHLVKASILEIKKLLREPGDHEFNDQAVKEFLGGLRKFADGVPQAEFEKIASGMKKHKL
ncbi:uncharacterized protein N7487_006268 [Penicillium crustosum]|uniref:uncharacterized protein n=1 Tax=Penicillium crustosum TaxID=36656 RepID=UPI00239F2799|nr:uncharacterized protein N7487_006268 [Penicillium crustosum]KAJ5411909.1 hypothetical protein N7487_006268 [Penicillium crustosum]